MNGPQRQGSGEGLEVFLAALVGFALGPFALAAGLGLATLFRARRRRWLWAAALPGSAAAVALWPFTHRHFEAALAALHGRLIRRPVVAVEALGPHLWPAWLATMLLSPLLALVLLHKHDRTDTAAELDDGPQRRARERSERRVAASAAAVGEPPLDPAGVFLGYSLGGDPLLPTRRGRVYLPLPRLSHHLLIAGATGSGKTETVLRLADSVARASDWAIVYIDGKGDQQNKERFAALMEQAGRSLRLFPDQAHDGWRGSPSEIAGRLLQLIDFAQEGGGAYYRDLAVNTVRLACDSKAGPPRSSRELLRRLHRDALLELHPDGSDAADEIAALSREQIDGIRARYAAFFTTLAGALDGTASFDQLDSGYFLLDGLRLKYEAGYLARFLIEDFTQWAVGRKPRDQRVLLIVDEFSAIAQAGQGLVEVVERARGFGVAAVLCPQLAEGMGSPEAAARIIGSAQTILLHAMATPEQLVRAAGTRRSPHTTRQLQGATPTGLGSTRPEDEYRADPNDVRRLKPGQCYAIGSGLAMKLQIAAAAAAATSESHPRA